MVAEASDQEPPGGLLTAPMPGRVVALLVEPGAAVERNQPLIVLEAMKMEHTLKAPQRGTVTGFRYGVGEQVEEGVTLVEFEPAET